MDKGLWLTEFVALIKGAGEFSGPLAIVAIAAYSGKFVTEWKSPTDKYGSYFCLALLAVGTIAVAFKCVVSLYRYAKQPAPAESKPRARKVRS